MSSLKYMFLVDGAIAQLGEHLHGMQGVGGSIPPGSTKIGYCFVGGFIFSAYFYSSVPIV